MVYPATRLPLEQEFGVRIPVPELGSRPVHTGRPSFETAPRRPRASGCRGPIWDSASGAGAHALAGAGGGLWQNAPRQLEPMRLERRVLGGGAPDQLLELGVDEL